LGHKKFLELLLDAGANVEGSDNQNNPLHEAVEAGHLAIVIRPVTANANLDVPRYRGSVPLHLAVQKGYLEIMKLLLDKGCTVIGPQKIQTG